MASEAIQIGMQMAPHPSVNANGSWAYLSLTNNNYRPFGWRFPGGATDIADYVIRLPQPIPPSINGTPAGKLRIYWQTASSSTNTLQLLIYLSDNVSNTDVTDPTTFDQNATSGTDANNGAGIENQFDVTISGPNLASGRNLFGVIRRNRNLGIDTLVADIIVTKVVFIADSA